MTEWSATLPPAARLDSRIDILQKRGTDDPLDRALRSQILRIDCARTVLRVTGKLSQIEITVGNGIADTPKLQAQRDLRVARVLVVSAQAGDVDGPCARYLAVKVFGDALRHADKGRSRVDGRFRGVARRALRNAVSHSYGPNPCDLRSTRPSPGSGRPGRVSSSNRGHSG